MCNSVPEWGLAQELVYLGLAGSVWVLDLVQGRFHNTNPGDFESTLVKAEDNETKEGHKVKEATGESLGGAALAH